MPPLLEARDLGRTFTMGGPFGRSRVEALRGFSLAFDEDAPSFVAVAGESGSGKTTLARLLLGLERPTEGAVLFRGRDLRGLARAERLSFRRAVQAVFQDPYEVYNPFYRVDHLLTVPVRGFGLAEGRGEARRLVEEAVRSVGLVPEETLGRYPHELSGGERQRLTVARVMLIGPRFVVADEPVSMIDVSLRSSILASLRRLHEEEGMSFLYITHDLATAYLVADSIVVLFAGTVVEAGDVESVVRYPAHPYTRELVASIPSPDPRERWPEREAPAVAARSPSGAPPGGCPYRARCASAAAACSEGLPPFRILDDGRAVACRLCDRFEPAPPGHPLPRASRDAGRCSPLAAGGGAG
jgi:peptide/nickel transport system ATP-binding protein